ncbi:MAG: VCBS repeat-containing protein [Bacteroidetes bacterium]|nr:VCBS repeat-containing protein [Bacteroidota bacterium]
MRTSFLLFLLITGLTSCQKNADALFETVESSHSGIDFRNDLEATDKLNILDYLYFYNGGGVAVGDINNDGLTDIYFVSNQQANKLYLNKGNWQFEDITQAAGVGGKSDWQTGVVMADVNGDGLLDIYVLAVVGVNGFNGHNELYINNGDLTFTEKSAEFGLDFDNFSSTAAFFDYDNDGDLDIYLLNHAVHTADSFGPADIRNQRNYETGDKLLRNDGNKFTDVSEEAGIFGGPNGYGLGVVTADFNNDGYTDIYVSNDFHEDDYFYINRGNGTFTENIKQYFGHTSRFSMGSDAADINGDGLVDLMTLDMLSDDEKVLKSSVGDDDYALSKFRTEKLQYHPQFARNMLQINRNTHFEETALMNGVAATDWSWSALLADFDNDTKTDLFISNGIPIRPNNLDFINYVSDEQIKQKLEATRLVDQKAIELMPSGTTTNAIFRGNGTGSFENTSAYWIPQKPTNSNGTAYADLDNDGDLDLVINNLNDAAQLLKNVGKDNHYLRIQLKTDSPNRFGIGTKVYLYAGGQKQHQQLFTSKGFQSSSEPVLHFGLGQQTQIDSLQIIWPDQTFETKKNKAINQLLQLSPGKKRIPYHTSQTSQTPPLFEEVTDSLHFDFRHFENDFNDFNRQKLIPYRLSDRGPAVAVGDANGDGKEDVFLGSSKFNAAQIMWQTERGFVSEKPFEKAEDRVEETDAVWLDLNSDGALDLFLVSAGDEFYGESPVLLDRLFLNSGDGKFTKGELPNYFGNGALVRAHDFDADGDLDLFVGSASVPYAFGKLPDSYLLINENGSFSLSEQTVFEALGMLTDAIVTDFDNDQQADLIVVGEWMSPTFLRNNRGQFEDVTKDYLPQKLNGLWQKITAFDIDNDGQDEYMLGNWGLNSKFSASPNFPLQMLVGDLDANGQTETVVSVAKNGRYYPMAGLDELSSQMLALKKKFNTYASFAGKTTEEIFSEVMDKTTQLTVEELRSGYLKKGGKGYTFVPFENALQIAPIREMLVYDFDANGEDEVLLGGNYFGITPYQGKLDAFAGAFIYKNGGIKSSVPLGLNFFQKQLQSLDILHIQKQPYLLVTYNNDKAQLFKILLNPQP